MSSAESNSPVSCHSNRIRRVQAREQPGALGSVPKSSTARDGRSGSGRSGREQRCTGFLLAAVLVAIGCLRVMLRVPRAWVVGRLGVAARPGALSDPGGGTGAGLSVSWWSARSQAGAGGSDAAGPPVTQSRRAGTSSACHWHQDRVHGRPGAVHRHHRTPRCRYRAGSTLARDDWPRGVRPCDPAPVRLGTGDDVRT
jgi:hypothetical protein